jgi:hypothetical protein
MAERKSPPSSTGKAAAKATAKLSGSRGSSSSRGDSRTSGTARTGGARPGSAPRPTGRPPAKKKKPGRSIVNQKQTPWGLIATTVAIVLFAGAIVGAVIATHKSSPAANGGCNKMIGSNKTTYLNELKCAADIQGVKFQAIAERNHISSGTVTYSASPPIGGNHSPYWADCAGTVYPAAIANENAVHMLEHGAIWITYKPGLSAGEVSTLSGLVSGKNYMAMSPYPGLDSNISLQSWGYQLKVDSATDPRIQQFITDLRLNPKTTPEYGATCSQPTFKAHPSTFGHPLFAPASK